VATRQRSTAGETTDAVHSSARVVVTATGTTVEATRHHLVAEATTRHSHLRAEHCEGLGAACAELRDELDAWRAALVERVAAMRHGVATIGNTRTGSGTGGAYDAAGDGGGERGGAAAAVDVGHGGVETGGTRSSVTRLHAVVLSTAETSAANKRTTVRCTQVGTAHAIASVTLTTSQSIATVLTSDFLRWGDTGNVYRGLATSTWHSTRLLTSTTLPDMTRLSAFMVATTLDFVTGSGAGGNRVGADSAWGELVDRRLATGTARQL